MRKRLLTNKLVIGMLVATISLGSLTGCTYEEEYVPMDNTQVDVLQNTQDGAVKIPNLTQTLPVKNESFSLVCKYDTGDYPLKNWHVTDVKSVNMDVCTKDLPEGYDVVVEHMHADISLVSQSAQINGITQDSMDNNFHGTSQDGFIINDKTSYYRTFAIEGYTEQFYQLWGSAFGSYGSLSSSYERLTEVNIIKVGTYAEKLSVVYDLAIKAPGEKKYHSTSVKSEMLIPINTNISTRSVDLFN